jgi:hypothetical protein
MVNRKMSPRFEIVLAAVAVFTLTIGATAFAEGSDDTSISIFKALPLFQAVELSWELKAPLAGEVTFQILRSETDREGSYEEIATVLYIKNAAKYLYVDKKIVKGSKYYYKLVVSGGGETHGPISAKGFFALPST